MKIKIGKKEIRCDSAYYAGSVLHIMEGGGEKMQIANFDISEVDAEGGEIEIRLSEIEEARRRISELEARIAELTEDKNV